MRVGIYYCLDDVGVHYTLPALLKITLKEKKKVPGNQS